MCHPIKLYLFAILLGYFIFNVDVGFAENLFPSGYNKDEHYGNHPTSTGDIAYVKLLTASPRRKRDLSSYSYHILEIHVLSKNKTIIVHLTKETNIVSSDFQTLVYDFDNGIEEPYVDKIKGRNNHDCFYSGVISGSDHGTASVSSCDEDTPGFIGVIVENGKHYIIQPLRRRKNGERIWFANTSSRYIVHTIKEIEGIAQPSQGSPKFEDGILQSLADQLSTKVKREISKNHLIIDSPLSEGNTDFKPHVTPLASPKTGKIKSSSNRKSKSGSNGIQKEIDLAIYTDAAMYRNFKKHYPQNTLKNMETWILTFVDAVNRIYQHPSLGMKISFRLVHLEIMKSDPSNLHPNLDGLTYLNSFRKFVIKKNPKVELWDHASLLTGVDIQLDGNPTLLGMAYEGTMCFPGYYSSIIQADSFESCYVAAHEYGHNLGTEHDAEKRSAACTTDTFLMAPVIGPGKVLWSPCSGKNILNFLTTGVDQANKKHNKNGPTCLDVPTKKSKPIKYESKLLPGEKYTAKDQCVFSLGPSAKPDGDMSKYCYAISCRYTHTELKGDYIKPIHPALEGTQCGSNKYCRGAVCTPRGK